MDIQKELNAFREVAQSKGWNIDGETTPTNYCFYCLTTRSGWEMWQAAKAQKVAVPEGFVLVPKEPTPNMMIAALAVISTGIGKDHIDVEIIQCWKKMIEAQEQAL